MQVKEVVALVVVIFVAVIVDYFVVWKKRRREDLHTYTDPDVTEYNLYQKEKPTPVDRVE